MKKVLISVCIVVICAVLGMIIHCGIAPQNSTGPDNTETAGEKIEDLTDQRVKEALDSNRNYVMEAEGLDIPFSADLLHMLENHFDTRMESLGAGLYRGDFADHITIELLCNVKGNVGQVQVCCEISAPDNELRSAIIRYSKFVNPSLENQAYQMVADEVLQIMREPTQKEPSTYFNHGLGFGLKSEDSSVIMYIP